MATMFNHSTVYPDLSPSSGCYMRRILSFRRGPNSNDWPKAPPVRRESPSTSRFQLPRCQLWKVYPKILRVRQLFHSQLARIPLMHPWSSTACYVYHVFWNCPTQRSLFRTTRVGKLLRQALPIVIYTYLICIKCYIYICYTIAIGYIYNIQ